MTDIPCVLFVEELLAAYPDAKVVLTTRDPDAWVASVNRSFHEILSWRRWKLLELVDLVSCRSFNLQFASIKCYRELLIVLCSDIFLDAYLHSVAVRKTLCANFALEPRNLVRWQSEFPRASQSWALNTQRTRSIGCSCGETSRVSGTAGLAASV